MKLRKIALLYFFLILVLCAFSACGKKNEDTAGASQPTVGSDAAETEKETKAEEAEVPEADLKAVCSAIMEQLNIEEAMPLETEALEDLYGISGTLVSESAGFVTMSGTFPDEVILIKAVDATAGDEIEECLSARLEEVMVQAETYDPENYALADKCQVYRDDLYLALMLSPLQEDMLKIYREYIK